MSLAQEIIAAAGKPDKVLAAMTTVVENRIALRARWMNSREALQPTLDAFELLGASISVDTNCCIDVRIAGDKECFVKCWKLWRELGVRLTPPEPGATQLSEFLDTHGLHFWFSFSSTVCKRVQVGTKMMPTPIYETHCGEAITIPELEQSSSPGALPPPNDIPF